MNGIKRIVIEWRGFPEEKLDIELPTDKQVLRAANELIKNIEKNMV